jgi:hypothetical protein
MSNAAAAAIGIVGRAFNRALWLYPATVSISAGRSRDAIDDRADPAADHPTVGMAVTGGGWRTSALRLADDNQPMNVTAANTSTV